MIASIKGKMILKEAGTVVIETGGIGYKVAITGETLAGIGGEGGEVSLWIHQVIREDSAELYGFLDRETLSFFELLITISGIGPKTALSVLNASSIANLKTAIGTGETSYLTKISGIGKKLAEKIVFELKEKIGPSDESEMSTAMKGDADVLAALLSLGYGEREARDALKKLPKDVEGTGNRVKAVLKVLAK